MLEPLPGMCVALGSLPNTEKNNDKQRTLGSDSSSQLPHKGKGGP